ncbi:hypothetical protein IV203_018583 [Nitzschia inconspicua]|uniref:Uncharacterized protein n=1 Tax=Nitzschia inconspicua TaxID=303405 RepID=A0A9K3M1X2_9STRA|nr:hypothetical protein IV203_018583 [Nitzschia inconspicua]
MDSFPYREQQPQDDAHVVSVSFRGTPPPPSVSNTSAGSASAGTTRTSPSNYTTPSSSATSQAPSHSGSFRLQPRKCNGTILSPSRNSTGGRLFGGCSSGGRKRGAHCLAPTFVASAGIQRKALFPPQTTASSNNNSHSTAESSPAAWSPPEEAMANTVAATSPSPVEHALQCLTLMSPVRTPYSQHQCWKGRASSPFRLYASPSPKTTANSGDSVINKGDSISSMDCASSATGLLSTSSPRHVPVLVIQKDGQQQHENMVTAPIIPPAVERCSSYMESSYHKREARSHESPIFTTTPPGHHSSLVVPRKANTPETHLSTPRMEDPQETRSLTHLGLRTPSSCIRSLPSPHDTPLPRVKLTPRRTGGMHASMTASLCLSSKASPSSSGFLDTQRTPDMNSACSSTTAVFSPLPPPSRSSNCRVTSYLPMPDWCNGMSPPTGKSISHVPPAPSADRQVGSCVRPTVAIRSLLASCGPHPSPSLQAMMSADAEAAALDCDGSLTDDDDDDELFVLTDPALLASERHENLEEGRPSQRRRTSIENHDSIESRRSSVASLPTTTAPSFNQASSSTSLLGMVFVRGDSVNSFCNSRCEQKQSNHKMDLFVLSGSFGHTSPEENQKGAEEEEYHLNRVKSESSLNSIGLDLDQSSSDLKLGARPKNGCLRVSERDLHTPPITKDDPAASSPKLCIRSNKSEWAYDIPGMEGRPSSVYLSRSDPGDVHRTIANLVMAQEKLSPPIACSR